MLQQNLRILGSLTISQYLLVHFTAQRQDVLESLFTLARRFNDRREEKFHPVQHVVRDSHAHQCIVITGPVSLKKVREIQGWLAQQSFVHQIQSYQQTPNPAVSIQKRVNGFELIMTDGNTHQL